MSKQTHLFLTWYFISLCKTLSEVEKQPFKNLYHIYMKLERDPTPSCCDAIVLAL